MNLLNYCLRSKIDVSLLSTLKKRSYAMFYQTSVFHCTRTVLLSAEPTYVIRSVPSRCFMKKMGLNPMYDVYNKKAAKDRLSPTEYTLIYSGTGELYVRYLCGAVMAALITVPSVFVLAYFYILFTERKIDLNTYLEVLAIPHSSLELMVMIPSLFLLKIASYSFISKYVLRIYRHNTKSQYVGVYVNPVLPWKNITCQFDTATKLPDGKNFLVPWHKEYYKLAGYKSIVLRERFRRPIDYERMLGTERTMDDE